jgi:UDP-glucose 4-epimerase
MNILNNHFLITGGAGFIGSYVCEYLLNHGAARVVVYDDLSRGSIKNIQNIKDDERCEFIKGDILNENDLNNAMYGIHGVFHLAGKWLLECSENPKLAFDVNIRGTLNVIESILFNNVKKIVFSSSASVYGEPESDYIKEDHPIKCSELYGTSKFSSELLINSYYNKYKESESHFDYISLRYMNVYGLRQIDDEPFSGVVAKMRRTLLEGGVPEIINDGLQTYDFIHVEDVACANIKAMESLANNQVYNIGSGMGTSISELAKILLNLSKTKMKPKYIKSDRFYVKRRVGDVSRAHKFLNFKSSIDIVDGLATLFRY